MQASGHFSYPHENNQPVLAPISRATGTGNCCLHGFSMWTLQDTTLIIHTGFPGISILGVGQLVIRRKVAKQLVTLVIRTRLSSSNWTLQLSAQEPPQLDTPRFLQQAHGQQSPHKIPQQLDTPRPSAAKAEANPGYPH